MRVKSGATFDVYLCDPFGVRLGDASRFVSLKYARTVNDVGSMTLVLPGSFNQQFIRAPDGRIEIWRRLPGTSREYLETDTTWLIKKVTNKRDGKGVETIIIEADTPLCLLREPGRFVNNFSGTATTLKTDQLDDMMKAIVRQQAGSSAIAARNYNSLLSVAADLGLAPSDTKAFAWRDVLKTLQEIANTSALQDTYLAFDIVAPTTDTLEFRTYVQQRGVDHRFPNGLNPVIISPDFGNMGECELSTDWRNEVTVALAGGRGEGSDRLTASAQDTTRTNMSPFGRREKFVNATSYDTSSGLQAEAEAAVRNGRPRQLFRGRILSVPDTRYGVHWAWGDYVTVQAFGQSFDARIDAIEVAVDDGKETINAWVRGDL